MLIIPKKIFFVVLNFIRILRNFCAINNLFDSFQRSISVFLTFSVMHLCVNDFLAPTYSRANWYKDYNLKEYEVKALQMARKEQ